MVCKACQGHQCRADQNELEHLGAVARHPDAVADQAALLLPACLMKAQVSKVVLIMLPIQLVSQSYLVKAPLQKVHMACCGHAAHILYLPVCQKPAVLSQSSLAKGAHGMLWSCCSHTVLASTPKASRSWSKFCCKRCTWHAVIMFLTRCMCAYARSQACLLTALVHTACCDMLLICCTC